MKKLILPGLMAACLMLTGCSQKPESGRGGYFPPETAETESGHAADTGLKGTVGETLTFNKISITLDDWHQVLFHEDPKDAYIVCTITVRNESDRKICLNYHSFSLEDGQGRELSPVGGRYSGDQTIESFDTVYIGMGGTFTGEVAFENKNGYEDEFILNYYQNGASLPEPTMAWDFRHEYPDSPKTVEDYSGDHLVIDPEWTTGKTLNLEPGESGEADGVSLTLTDLRYDDDPGNFSDLQEGYEFLIATVKVENHTGGRIDLDPDHWLLEDGGHAEYTRPSAYTIAADDVLEDLRLADGGYEEGQLVFLVKKEEKSLKLNYYSEYPWGKPEISWTIR